MKEYYNTLTQLLSSMQSDTGLLEIIVNAPFSNKLHATSIDLGIIGLSISDKNRSIFNRVVLSDTEHARWAAKMTPIAFQEIAIPLDDKFNILAKAIRTGVAQKTADWKFLFSPALSAEAARFNQAGAGIACTYTYPLINSQTSGALFFSFYQPLDKIQLKHLDFMEKYSSLVSRILSGKNLRPQSL